MLNFHHTASKGIFTGKFDGAARASVEADPQRANRAFQAVVKLLAQQGVAPGSLVRDTKASDLAALDGPSDTNRPLLHLSGVAYSDEARNEPVPFSIEILTAFETFGERGHLVHRVSERQTGMALSLADLVEVAPWHLERLTVGIELYEPRKPLSLLALAPMLVDRLMLDVTPDRITVEVGVEGVKDEDSTRPERRPYGAWLDDLGRRLEN